MENEVLQKLRIKDFIFCFCVLMEVLGLLYWFCDFNINSIKETENLPTTFYILSTILIVCTIILFYPAIRYYIKQCLNKFCVPECELRKFNHTENIKQKLNIDDSYEKQNLASLENKDIIKSEQLDKFDGIFNLLKNNKNEIAIEQCTKQMEKTTIVQDKMMLTILRYFGCIQANKDMYNQYLEDDIKKILQFKNKIDSSGKQQTLPKSLESLFIGCHSNLVVLYYKQQRFEEMQKENKKLISLIINNPFVDNSLKAKSLQLRAMYHIEKKQIAYAIGYFNEALSYVYNEYYILYNMYMLYFHEYNNLSKSIEILLKMLALDNISIEHYEDTVNSLAYILSLQGRYEVAYEYLDNFCTQNNPDERTLANKCYLANKLKKDDEAKNLINQIMNKIPCDVSCLKIKSIYQIENGEYDYAIQNLSDAIQQFENIEKNQKNHFFTGEAYYYRAIAYLKKGERQKAHQDFDRAIECGFYDFDSQYIVDFDLDNEDIKSEKPLDRQEKTND